MNEKENLVPKRRFKEFKNSDAWEQRKVADMSEENFGGGTPKTGIKEYWQGDLPWIQSSDLKNEQLINVKPKKFITDEAIKKSAAKVIPSNSIAIVTRVGVGKLALMPFPYATSQDFFSLSKLTVDPCFGIYSLFKLLQREINNIQGTSIKGMTKVDLLDKNVQIPPCSSEQIKIGTFFKHLDDTIALHQRKLDKSKELKSAYLSEMFPTEGERKPKRRFAGFTDDWEQRKLIEVADMFDNLRVPVTASDRIKGDTPYYGANGIQDYVNGFTHEGEFVLIAEDGANDLINYPVQYVRGKVWVNNHAHVVSGKAAELDNLFLTARIKAMNISSMLVGGGRAKLNGEVLKKIPIKIPVYEEQSKIGVFFKQLDDTIALHQRKLEKLQNIKKAYLNELFI